MKKIFFKGCDSQHACAKCLGDLCCGVRHLRDDYYFGYVIREEKICYWLWNEDQDEDLTYIKKSQVIPDPDDTKFEKHKERMLNAN
jgi:hypothetical protein